MTKRYLTYSALLLAGGFLTVASMASPTSRITWIPFGVSTAILALMLWAQMGVVRTWERVVASITAVLAAAMIVCSLVFQPTLVGWLGFAFGLAYFGSALCGLTLNEVASEARVVRHPSPTRAHAV